MRRIFTQVQMNNNEYFIYYLLSCHSVSTYLIYILCKMSIVSYQYLKNKKELKKGPMHEGRNDYPSQRTTNLSTN